MDPGSDITLRKKVSEICTVQRLVFKWEGDRVRSLFGSLYLQDPKKGWMLTPEHLIADSRWDSYKQELTFECSKPMHIGSTTTIGLVLLVPNDLTATLKKGSFRLDRSCLPKPMALSLDTQSLTFSWNSKPGSIS